MMRHWTMAALPLAAALLGACSSNGHEGSERQAESAGPTITKDFALSGFTGVKLATGDNVVVKQGDAFSIKVTGPQHYLDELELTVSGSILAIERDNDRRNISQRDRAKIEITMPRLSTAKLAGSGNFDADIAEGDDVDIAITGSGDLRIAKLTATKLDLSISGSGDLNVDSGDVKSGSYSLAGSGDIDASGVKATDLDISVAGSGNVDAQASGKAAIRVLGSGDVKVGGGATCTSRKLGSGGISCG